MPAVEVMDGEVVRLWFRVSADALGRNRAAIDMLNVFPVPDADTGTNLHRTIASAADALAGLPAHASAADIWQAAATAALRGACGNSGIIISQLLRGLADTCGPAVPCDGQVVAIALGRAAVLARAAVHRPLEGTVLTVADAAALAAARATGLAEVAMAASLGARQALVRTQQQLGILAASGVVDAGAAGLCVVLDALSAVVCGTDHVAWEVPGSGPVRPAAEAAAAGQAYEVTFLLDATQRPVADLRAALDLLGDSLVVSGRDPLWHVHVHAADAGAVIEAGLAAGRLSKITVTSLNGAPAPTPAARPTTPNAVVTVAEGAGLRQLLADAGATVLDAGAGAGQAALDELAGTSGQDAAARPGGAGHPAAPAVLIAPSGPVANRWPAGWPVIEIGCQVQSLAALAVHDPLRDQADDVTAMRRAVAAMRWASLGTAAAAGQGQAAAAIAMTSPLLGPRTEMITLVTGQAAEPELGVVVARHLASVAPAVEVVCYDGGMTSAVLLIGAE